MLDFLLISTRSPKRGVVEIYPDFLVGRSSDLMIRGSDFYAVWVEERGLWSTDEQDVIDMIDRELDNFAKDYKPRVEDHVRVLHMRKAETGMIDRWHKYCQKQSRDSFHMLDEKLIFSNSETNKKDYASKRLPYPLEPGSMAAYDKLMSTLYSVEERRKIEWAIGAIVSGDSKKIQKFLVLYGEAGTGKSTVLNIIQKLFDGYYSVFDAKALGSATNAFALEAFRDNPLVAIQHDGDLSRIEDNTRLNSLVSHELMMVNEKFKSTYKNQFKCFLFMGTNKPVKITDAKSGLIRRLIDVSPSGNKLPAKEYKATVKQIDFELGAIANHCLEVYSQNPGYYDDYIPVSMLGASNDFYNFVGDAYNVFSAEDSTTLKAAWEMYKTYCEEAKVAYPFGQRAFKEELKNYFREYHDRYTFDDNTRIRSYYIGFRREKFEESMEEKEESAENHIIQLNATTSIFDELCANYPAQYATDKGTPTKSWERVRTTLSALDTSRLHFVKVPENHIVIDFDIPDANGGKCLSRNLEEASKWPPTYTELSKSGAGVHLHYIYSGDVSKLQRVYDKHIEVKVFNGKSSLRRKLTKCNDLPIATINSGLPLKGDTKMVNFEQIKSEKGLRTMIKRNMNKEFHPGTKPSIDFIYKILEDAYNSGLSYDVTDMRNDILSFAINSTHQAEYCIKQVNKMKFKSEEQTQMPAISPETLVFYDIEVFPNLFLVNYKMAGEGKPVQRMINPTPTEITKLMQFPLVGFNCRRYDNHILYARQMGYTNEMLYDLSQRIINGGRDCFFSNAYDVSYTDVYDFASAGNKKSLKKLEIEMGIHHQELGLPWDQPVPEHMWEKVAEYCDNDVIATEAAFNYLHADWTARQILADLAGMTVNDTTNTLTTRIIFGNNRKPQGEFNYRNLAEPIFALEKETKDFLEDACPGMMAQKHTSPADNVPFDIDSTLPYFPGYKFEGGKSIYRGFEVGEGGFVYAEPGIYVDVALLDVSSMHPHSAIAECLFGPRFTKAFREIVEGRVSIKHEAWDEVNNMLDGKLTPYIQKVINGEMTSGQLANALKTAINSVYGLTAAGFENPFRDPRNKDNIVAKRGALFMIDLMFEVQKRGFTVAHIKTDSIKIPNATPEIIQFVMEFGERYGYSFEHEATYDRMCLVNDAVYIAKYTDGKKAGQWTATGTQFQVPYVFKTLFSKEEITFEDMCETKSVTSALYLDFNEDLITPESEMCEKELYIRNYNEQNENAKKNNPHLADISTEELQKVVDAAHNYRFIGKVSSFCPVKPGCGGGLLMREVFNQRTGRRSYAAATGSKGYRWKEAEIIRELGKDDQIDRSYYDALVDEAVKTIEEYGDFKWFVSDNSEEIESIVAINPAALQPTK